METFQVLITLDPAGEKNPPAGVFVDAKRSSVAVWGAGEAPPQFARIEIVGYDFDTFLSRWFGSWVEFHEQTREEAEVGLPPMAKLVAPFRWRLAIEKMAKETQQELRGQVKTHIMRWAEIRNYLVDLKGDAKQTIAPERTERGQEVVEARTKRAMRGVGLEKKIVLKHAPQGPSGAGPGDW